MIEVQVDKPVYRIGEFIVLTVRSNQDCYLALYDISTEGEVSQIFPNKYANDNLIAVVDCIVFQRKQIILITRSPGPPGIERVCAVCTQKNVNIIDPSVVSKQEPFHAFNKRHRSLSIR